MRINKICISYLVAILFALGTSAQNQTKKPAPAKPAAADKIPVSPSKVADDLFAAGNYIDAATEYAKVLGNTKDDRLSFQLGICYLKMNNDKSKAIPFLEPLATTAESFPGVFYYLGKAYTYANKFDEAMKFYTMAKGALPKEVDQKMLERDIEMCKNAMELIKKPVDVVYENLGDKINTPYPDYSPWISFDESFLIFNSRREADGVKLQNGYFTSDVYISEVADGNWKNPLNIGEVVNTKNNDEQIIGVSADGLTLIFNLNNTTGETNGDIFVGPKFQNQILKPFKINETVNSKSHESSAAISPDGRTLYFASNRPGGFGGFDLYRAKILPNGEWSEGLNLGPEINTPYDEDFPFLSMDGKQLYFASKGHNSMGGYDLFKCEMKEENETWMAPTNLGYPINDAYDNNSICLSGKGRYGYISAIRPEGKGDMDIYRIVFNKVDAELTVVKGLITSANPNMRMNGAKITVKDLNKNKNIGEYLPNPNTYKYVIILPPGEYEMSVVADGYTEQKEKISIMGKGSFVPIIEKNISLNQKK